MSFDLREWQVIPGNWNRLNEILGLLGSQEIPGLVVTASGVLSRNTDVTSSSFGDITLNYDATQFDESPAGTLHIQHFHTLATESTFVGVDTEDGGANYDTHVGYQAGKANAAAHNIFIGAEVAKDNVEGFANTAIGNYNMLNASGPVTRNTAIGYYNQLNLLSYNNYSSASGNTSIGAFCASNAKTALFNEAIGYYALYTNRYGHGNCATGYRTLYKLDAIERVITAFADAGGGNTTVTVDDTTGLSNGVNIRITGTTNYDGPYTVANFVGSTFDIVKAFVADDAMGYITIIWEASANVAMGGDTGYNTTTGAQNVYMGFECAYSNQTGMRNIFIGYQAGYNEMGSDKLYIENSDSVNPLIYGEFDNDLVNINGQLNVISTSTPQFTLTNGATTATFALDAGGDLTIAASGGDISFDNNNLTTGGTGEFTGGLLAGAGDVVIDTENQILNDSSSDTSLNWNSRTLNASGGTDVILDWNIAGLADFGNSDIITAEHGRFDGGLVDSSSRGSIYIEGRALYDTDVDISVDWENRKLYADGGADAILDWGTVGLADFGNSDITTTGDITASHYNDLKIDLTGTRNIFLGETLAGDSITSGTDNICMGTAAGNALTSGVENFFFGYNAGLVTTTGSYNFGLGVAAGAYITGGSFNTGVGRTSIYGVGNGSGNVGVGYKALWGVAGNNPNYNTVIGSFAFGGTNTSKSGSENTILGYRAGNLLVSGSGNVFLGYMAGGQELGSNKLYIDNSNTTTPLIYGEFDNNLLVVNGDLEIAGDLTFTSAGDGLCYGSCSCYNIGWTQVAAQNTWYNVVDAAFINGQLNNVAHDGNGKLTVTNAGIYKVDVSLDLEVDAANTHVEIGFEVSGSGSAATEGIVCTETKFADKEHQLSTTALLDLAANATIELCVRTTDAGTPTIIIDCVNMNCVQVGGT